MHLVEETLPLILPPIIKLNQKQIREMKTEGVAFPPKHTRFNDVFYLTLFQYLDHFQETLLSELYPEDFLYVYTDGTLLERANLSLYHFLSACHERKIYWYLRTDRLDWNLRGYFFEEFYILDNIVSNYPQEVN